MKKAKTKPTPKAVRPKKAAGLQAMDLAERTKLIAILNDPVLQKALSNASFSKPTAFYSGAGTKAAEAQSAEMAVLLANNRLHEIRGWEMFEAAIFLQTLDPKPQRSAIEENFPDTGLIDHE